MAAMPFVDEFIYMVAPSSDDGTIELLAYLKEKMDKLQVHIAPEYDFNPMDMVAYNKSFNDGIKRMTGDAAWFLHPDMIVTAGAKLKEGPLAWTTEVKSFAGDMNTVITKGRTDRWKNIHAKKFGLHYFGGYGSVNEDFYHSDITGKSYRHYGSEFAKYPFEVAASGIKVNHYCEVKAYSRRLEKMKLCLETQNPWATKEWIESAARQHPRVTLEPSTDKFGSFEFSDSKESVPGIIQTYEKEFEQFKPKEAVHG